MEDEGGEKWKMWRERVEDRGRWIVKGEGRVDNGRWREGEEEMKGGG